MNHSLENIQNIKEENLEDFAKLIYQSAVQFYEIFPLNLKETKELIKESLICENNSNELQARFLYYLRKIKQKEFHKSLMEYFKTIPPIEEEGTYLSRIAVVESERGKGTATELLKLFEESANKYGSRKLFLHVHIENLRAIKFYENHGYKKVQSKNANNSEFKYFLLLKNL